MHAELSFCANGKNKKKSNHCLQFFKQIKVCFVSFEISRIKNKQVSTSVIMLSWVFVKINYEYFG